MKKAYILSLFSLKGTLVGLVVLAGFILNFAFTFTPTQTRAVFGSQDTSYRFILSQGSETMITSDSLGIDPLNADEPQVSIGLTTDSVIAK